MRPFLGFNLYAYISHGFLTNSKQLDSSISQALCRGNDVILRLPICDKDPDLGYSSSGARLRLEAVLQDISQCKP